MERKTAIEKLANIIEENPDCNFSIDNDSWRIEKGDDCLARSSDFEFNTKWYSTSNNYGVGLAEVMIELLNRKGYKITAEAV